MLSIVYVYVKLGMLFENVIMLQLEKLNLRPHFFPMQLLVISYCSAIQSLIVLVHLWILVSSAKISIPVSGDISVSHCCIV